MPELTDETLTLLTQNEVMALNLAIDTGGYACPGPILGPWAKAVGDTMKELQARGLAAVIQGQASPDVLDGCLYDYLVVAFRVGYEAGRQKLEVPICQENHGD